jgi:hypothetical protein
MAPIIERLGTHVRRQLVGYLALFVALGGSAYAVSSLPKNSVGTRQLKNDAVTSAKVQANSLTGGDINESMLGPVGFALQAGNATKLGGNDPSAFLAANGKAVDASHADGATNADSATNAGHATNADSATTAGTATNANVASIAVNANALGGVTAGRYTRTDCSLARGAIKGFAYVPASTTFSSSFVDLAGAYNCSGQEVQARRTETGGYQIKFLGSPVRLLFGNGNTVTDVITTQDTSDGTFDVAVFNSYTNNFIDHPFKVLAP